MKLKDISLIIRNSILLYILLGNFAAAFCPTTKPGEAGMDVSKIIPPNTNNMCVGDNADNIQLNWNQSTIHYTNDKEGAVLVVPIDNANTPCPSQPVNDSNSDIDNCS